MKTSPKRSYSVIENERCGLVFAKTGSIISGTEVSVCSLFETVPYNRMQYMQAFFVRFPRFFFLSVYTCTDHLDGAGSALVPRFCLNGAKNVCAFFGKT